MSVKVGDTLYTSPYGRPERVGAESATVTGETTLSWLVGERRYGQYRVNKKTMREAVRNMGWRDWFTAEGLAEEDFRRKNRHLISSAVLTERDVKKLKRIAEVLEMNLP